MNFSKISNFLLLAAFCVAADLISLTAVAAEKASVASIKPSDLIEYPTMKPEVQKIVREALELTKKKLGYKYGSNSPKNKGMDCSGTVQHTLNAVGLSNIPRSSYAMYHWAKDAGTLHKVSGVHSHDHTGLSKMKPGDLLFWEGTYATTDRVPPISHVMIYLGTLKADGKKVMYGASSGRRYRGKKIHGVSVFDFSLPSATSKAKFVGYGPIPGLKKIQPEPEKKVAFFKKEPPVKALPIVAAAEVPAPVVAEAPAPVSTEATNATPTPQPTRQVATAKKVALPKLFPKLRAALSRK